MPRGSYKQPKGQTQASSYDVFAGEVDVKCTPRGTHMQVQDTMPSRQCRLQGSPCYPYLYRFGVAGLVPNQTP